MCDWRERLRDGNHDCVAEKVVSAVDRLLKNDAFLLEKQIHECAITHRLAVYLENEFPGWHVDCEYNRDRDSPKQADVDCTGEDRVVRPDIIIHHRGMKDNLLAVEAKKTPSTPEDDLEDEKRLRAYKNDPKLQYQHALFLKFACGASKAGVDEARWV